MRQKIANGRSQNVTIRLRHQHVHIGGMLEQDLSAGSAWRAEQRLGTRNGNADEIMLAFGDCFEQGRSFRANRQAVHAVLHIGASEHRSVGAEQCRTNREARVRAVRPLARLDRKRHQFVIFDHR